MADNTPDNTLSESAAISGAALHNAIQEYSTGATQGARFDGSVTSQTVPQIAPGFPEITYHRGSFGYNVPITGR